MSWNVSPSHVTSSPEKHNIPVIRTVDAVADQVEVAVMVIAIATATAMVIATVITKAVEVEVVPAID
jgi:hypothetical protein